MGRGGIGGTANIGHEAGGIGGSLNEHDAQVLRRANSCIDQRRLTGFDGDAFDAPLRKKILDQLLRAAVDGHGIDDRVAGLEEREQSGHDGGHAGVEGERALGAGFEGENLILENFRVGMIEARID